MHNTYIRGKFRKILPYYRYKSIFSMKYIISNSKWGTPMVRYCGNIKRSLWHWIAYFFAICITFTLGESWERFRHIIATNQYGEKITNINILHEVFYFKLEVDKGGESCGFLHAHNSPLYHNCCLRLLCRHLRYLKLIWYKKS